MTDFIIFVYNSNKSLVFFFNLERRIWIKRRTKKYIVVFLPFRYKLGHVSSSWRIYDKIILFFNVNEIFQCRTLFSFAFFDFPATYTTQLYSHSRRKHKNILLFLSLQQCVKLLWKEIGRVWRKSSVKYSFYGWIIAL